MPVALGHGKIYVGNSKQIPRIWSNSSLGHYGFQGTSWDWSYLNFSGAANSFKFVPDPNDGGLQGDFSIGTGSQESKYPAAQSTYDLNSTIYEIEPAGGTGQFSMFGRDYSYSFKLGPVFISYQYTKTDNEIEFNEGKFLFTNISNASKAIERTKLFPTTNTTAGNTYIQEYNLDVVKPTTVNGTNAPQKDGTSDYTLSFSIGSNNTPESVYTDIVLTGFYNESSSKEYFKSSSTFGSNSFKHDRNVPWKNLDSERALSGTLPKDMTMLRIWQKPNIFYYVHMKFINLQYTDYDNPPSPNMVLEHWTVGWDVLQEEILVYIEFGVSPNGGKTIWWNGVEADENIGGTIGAKLRKRGITTVVPTNINEYLTTTLLNYSKMPTNINGVPEFYEEDIPRYNISTKNAKVYGSKAFKYVRIPIWTDLRNDEYANTIWNRVQKYQMINFKDVETTTTETGVDDPDIDKTTHQRLGDYWAKWKNNSQSAEYFQIGRKNKTNPWSTNIHIDLFYKKDSLKYIGATDGKTVVSKS